MRNAGWLLVQRVASAASGALFAVTVPRLMGPDLYGRYALVVSLILWFTLLGSMGFTQAAARFVPELSAPGREHDLRRFLAGFMGLRALTGGAGAIGLAVFGLLCLRELGGVAILAAAVAIALRGVANLMYAFFLGLNWAARWGMGQVVRGWVALVFVAAGAWLGGLRGACIGLAATEIAVVCLAARWGRAHLVAPRLDWAAVRPYLPFGLAFVGVELTNAAFRYSGGLGLRWLAGDYAEVGRFSLAVEINDVAGMVFPQVALSLAPLLAGLWVDGRRSDAALWLVRLSASLGALGMAVAIAAAVAGEAAIPAVLGGQFAMVTPALVAITVSLPFVGLNCTAQVAAVTGRCPAWSLACAVAQLATFWTLAPALVWRWGSTGCAMAYGASQIAAAAISAVILRRVADASFVRWGLTVVLGLPLLALSGRVHAVWPSLAAAGAAAAGYLVLLAVTRIAPFSDLVGVWRGKRTSGDTGASERRGLPGRGQ